jgi:peptide/nickel transport system permease protein
MRAVIVRLLTAVPLVLVVVSATFFLSLASKVDPAEIMLGAGATQEQVDALRHQLGLDRPAFERYTDWLSGLLHGDLGSSLYSGMSVTELFLAALPITLSLTAGGLLIGVLLGVGSGLLAAVVAGSRLDRGVILLSTMGQAAPSFFVGMLIIYLFALRLGWFPATGYVSPVGERGWLAAVARASVARARLRRRGGTVASGPLEHDHRVAAGLHAYRPEQGALAPAGGAQARRAECGVAGGHVRLVPGGAPARWGDRD